jgi:hypothetical protein
MISYEVTLRVPEELLERLDAYMLDKHIADVIATGHFAGAAYYRDREFRRTIYDAHDRPSLDAYLANDAARLRADFAAHFPEGIVASRAIWEAVAGFNAP